MTEREHQLEAYGVDHLCAVVGCPGIMAARTGSLSIVMNENSQWLHDCTACKSEAFLADRYPTVRYRRK